jgi:hypothetical protein
MLLIYKGEMMDNFGWIRNIFGGMGGAINDLWHVHIKGMHKHNFVRQADVENPLDDGKTIYYPFWKCECGASNTLEPWQIERLPASMRYQKIGKEMSA